MTHSKSNLPTSPSQRNMIYHRQGSDDHGGGQLWQGMTVVVDSYSRYGKVKGSYNKLESFR